MLPTKWFFLPLALLFLSPALSAQQRVNTDSLSLVSKISNDQLKLGKLQNKIEQMTRDKHDAAKQAQISADANSTAANRLSAEPQDKKLANQADNKASDAKSDSRNARKTSDKLDHLNKEILDLQDNITKNQRKLNMYQAAGVVMPMPPIPVQTDTTNHR
jgi:hypothetical protein